MFHHRFTPVALALLFCAVQAGAETAAKPNTAEPALESETVQLENTGTANDGLIELGKVKVQTTQDSLKDVLSPGVVSVAYPDDVKGEHKSLPDLLDSIPGVYVRRVSGSGHYTTASIRGSAPSQVNIYIDGVPVNTSSETAADLSTIALSNVERVEVYRGVTPARFSGAPIGGAINIVTKAPQKAGGSVSVGRREYGGRQESLSLNTPLLGGKLLFGLDQERSDGDFDYENYAIKSLNSIVYNDGHRYPHGQPGAPRLGNWVTGSCHGTPGPTWCPPQGVDFPEKRTRLNNGFHNKNALLKWENDHFHAKLAYLEIERYLPASLRSVDRYDEHYADLPDSIVAQYGQAARERRIVQNLEQHDVLVGWRDQFGDLSTTVNLTYMRRKHEYENKDTPRYRPNRVSENQYLTERYGISGDLVWEIGQDSAIGQTIEFHADYYEETLHTDDASFGNNSDFIDRYHRDMTRFQLQDTFTLNRLWGIQITPIVRTERLRGPIIGTRWTPLQGPGGEYDWETTGSLSLKKRWASGWQVFASGGDYIRYPSFYEIYGNGLGLVSRTDSTGRGIQILPEKGQNVDVGFGWDGRLSESISGSFQITWFEREAENAITLYSVPIAAAYINSGDTRTDGIELEAKLTFGQRADFQFAATYQEGHYVNGGWYYFGGTSASQRNPGQTVHVLNIPKSAINARLNLHWFDRRLSTYIEANRTGRVWRDVQFYELPLTTVGLGAHLRLPYDLTLSFGLNDLFNKGPQQKYKGRNHENVYQHCDSTDFFYCFFGGGTKTYREVHEMDYNVRYPQQGRTWYASLGWKF